MLFFGLFSVFAGFSRFPENIFRIVWGCSRVDYKMATGIADWCSMIIVALNPI
jgi:hypothetical protein